MSSVRRPSCPVEKKWQEQFWLTELANWYEAVAKRVLSTNNAMESVKNIITSSFRKFAAIGKIIRRFLKETVNKWSDEILFKDVPVITQTLWLSSYRFAKEGRYMEFGACINDTSAAKKNKSGMNIKKWRSFDRFLGAINVYELSLVNNDKTS